MLISRKRIYDILESEVAGDIPSKICDYAIIFLILGSVVTVILESMPGLSRSTLIGLYIFDYFAVIAFTVEYFLRVNVCVVEPKYQRPIIGRLKFMMSPMALIDLVAILPYLIPIFFSVDLAVIGGLRVLRLLRLFKLTRYSQSLRMLGYIVRSKKDYLAVVFCMELVLLVVVASVMHSMEHDVQPEHFGTIPDAMWWAVVTLTTVGYGDVVPMTPIGKMAGGFLAIMGVSLFAVPAGIMAAGFNEQMMMQRERKRKKTKVCCPHCGEKFVSNSLFYADGTNIETLATLTKMKQELDELVGLAEHSVHHQRQARLDALAKYDEMEGEGCIDELAGDR